MSKLDKIEELGDYTMLTKYNGELRILAYNGFYSITYIKVSTVMKAIFDIKVSIVILIKMKAKCKNINI